MAWLITQHGFISAVEYRPKKDHTNQLPESLQPLPATATRRERRKHEKLVKDGFILARARVKEDLEQLRPYFTGLTIVQDKGADYKWRAVVPRRAFADWIFNEAWDIDYDSHFKEVAKERSPHDANRYSAMMSCWTALNRMGSPYVAPYSSGWRGSGSGSGGTSASRSPFGHNKTTSVKGSDRGRDFDWDRWQREQEQALDDLDFDGLASDEKASLSAEEEQAAIHGMVQNLLRKPVEQIQVRSDMADAAFDLWCTASDLMSGQTGEPMEPAQVLEALNQLIADDTERNLESPYVAARDALTGDVEALAPAKDGGDAGTESGA